MNDLIRFIPEYKPRKVISILSEVTDWGSKFTNISKYRDITKSSGENIKVAILDTGVNLNHPDLAANIKKCKDFTGDNDPEDHIGHGCINPEAYIYTSFNGLQKIEEIFEQFNSENIYLEDGIIIKLANKEDIYTLSFNKNFETIEKSKIEAIHKIPYNGDIIRVKTKNNEELLLTPWHKVYTLSNKKDICIKRADQLDIKDRIICSFNSNDNINDNYIKFPLKMEYTCNICGDKATNCQECNHEPDITYITINEDFAFWLGLVLSCGHIDQLNNTIEFNNVNKTIIDKFNELSIKIFNNDCIITYDPEDSIYICILSMHYVVKLINNMKISYNNKSLDFQLPSVISKSKKKVIDSFFAGYIEGDGNVSEDILEITTNKKVFAQQSVLLLKTLGRKAKFIENNTESYSIKIDNINAINDKLITKKVNKLNKDKNKVSYKIQEISKEKYNGYLYDFTIKDNHNYVANGMVVSNTHVAGIIAGVDNGVGIIGIAPKSELYIGKVLNNQGLCPPDYSWIIKGLEWAIEENVDIVNMSLGAPTIPPDKFSQLIKTASSKGMILVAASGNEQLKAIDYPARYNEVISVAAMDKNGNLANYSNIDQSLDFVAPGTDIYSTYLNGGYATISGTCIPEDTNIFMENGIKELKDVNIGDSIISLNDDGKSITINKIKNKWSTGTQKTYKISTQSWELEATGNHPILTLYKDNKWNKKFIWKRLDELKLEDNIVTLKYAEYLNNGRIIDKKSIKNIQNSLLSGLVFNIEKVDKIEESGEKEVFDIEMQNSDYPSFIANGIAVHNSMASPFIAGVSSLLLSYHRNGKEHVTPIRDYRDVMSHIKKFEKGRIIDFGNGKGIGILYFDNEQEIELSGIKTDNSLISWKVLIRRSITNFINKIFKRK